MINPRKIACLTLVRQEQNGYSNLVLSNALGDFKGDLRDKAFITALFYGTLERLITIDAILSMYLPKPLAKMDKEVRAILRSGLYQAKYMDSVPESAAINEAVKLTRQLGKSSASGLVNAVLRRAINTDEKTLCFGDEAERLSVLYSVSKPIAKTFIDNFEGAAENELLATFTRARLCIRVNSLKISADELIKIFENKSIKSEKGQLENCIYINYSNDITQLEEFKKGYFHVQGETSQLACAALNAKKGSKVLDLCAAPGGKSATIAQYMENSGELICADTAENRLSLIETLLKRNGVECAKIIHNNAQTSNENFKNADYVLCDVPCSGLGVISKKPDIRMKTLDDIDNLVKLQEQILKTAAGYLKIGGKLVYSTCTINSRENEDVVNSFLKRNENYKAVLLSEIFDNARKLGEYRLFTPYFSKLDGFFVATLERLW